MDFSSSTIKFKRNHRGYHGELYMSECIHVDFGPICLACGDSSHLMTSCPNKNRFVCHYCYKRGHTSWVCYMLNGLCAKCHCRGHRATDCELYSKREWRRLFRKFWKYGKLTILCQGDLSHPFGFYKSH